MNSRLYRKILAAVACAVLISGCDRFKKSDAEPEPTPVPIKYVESKGEKKLEESDGRLKLILVAGKDKTEVLQKLITDYNNQSLTVLVELKELPEDKKEQYIQLSSALETGETSYDILDIDSGWSAEFASKGYIAELDKHIQDAGIDLSLYMPNALVPSLYNGKMYSMPRTASISMIFFRKDIIETAPGSWGDIIRLSETYQGDYGTTSGYIFGARGGFDLSWAAMELINTYNGFEFDGAVMSNVAPGGLRAGLKQLYDIYHAKGTAKDINLVTQYEAGTRFFNGENIIMRNSVQEWFRGNGVGSAIAGKFAIGPMPRAVTGNPDILWCTSLAINENSRYKEEAWGFINYMISYEPQQNAAIYGGILPVLTDSMNSREILGNNPYFMSDNFRESLFAARPQISSVNYGKMLQVMEDKLADYLVDYVGLDETVNAIENEMQALLVRK